MNFFFFFFFLMCWGKKLCFLFVFEVRDAISGDRDKNIVGRTNHIGKQQSKEPVLICTTRIGEPDNMHLVELYNFCKPAAILFASCSFLSCVIVSQCVSISPLCLVIWGQITCLFSSHASINKDHSQGTALKKLHLQLDSMQITRSETLTLK